MRGHGSRKDGVDAAGSGGQICIGQWDVHEGGQQPGQCRAGGTHGEVQPDVEVVPVGHDLRDGNEPRRKTALSVGVHRVAIGIDFRVVGGHDIGDVGLCQDIAIGLDSDAPRPVRVPPFPICGVPAEVSNLRKAAPRTAMTRSLVRIQASGTSRVRPSTATTTQMRRSLRCPRSAMFCGSCRGRQPVVSAAWVYAQVSGVFRPFCGVRD